jgi:hypothetical protein
MTEALSFFKSLKLISYLYTLTDLFLRKNEKDCQTFKILNVSAFIFNLYDLYEYKILERSKPKYIISEFLNKSAILYFFNKNNSIKI